MKPHYLPVLFLVLLSCGRIKQESREALHDTKEKAGSLKDAAVDKVFPRFDDVRPDTDHNRRRFREFFHFAPGPDVHNLYCIADQMGIDSKFAFAFRCNEATRDRIIRELSLKKDGSPDADGSGLWPERPWWPGDRIRQLKPWHKKSDQELYQQLWYDPLTQTAYYFEFDL
jgi:hypothetical protein